MDGGFLAPAVSFVTGESRSAILSGLTIQHGAPSPTINGVAGGAGGIYIYQSQPTLLNNNVTQNQCFGIDIAVGGPLVQGNEVSGTLLVSSNPRGCFTAGGAGIYVGSNLNYNLTSNSGIRAVLLGNIIENNIMAGITGPFAYGGAGIYVESGSPLIEGNTLRNNAAPGGAGGAIFVLQPGFGSVAIVQNLIYGNSAGCGGGALAIRGDSGGATGSYALIANNTIVNNVNTQNTTGGGAGASECYVVSQITPDFEYSLSGPTIAFVNNILSGSTVAPATTCAQAVSGIVSSENTQPVFDHNLLYNAGGSFFDSDCIDVSGRYGNIVADPQFLNPGANDYHLRPTSPAVDSGNNSALLLLAQLYSATLPKDFDGTPRQQDFTGKGYPTIDMGAYELAGLSDATPTTAMLTPSAYTGAAGPNPLTATLFSPLGTPTGSVAFFLDSKQIGTATLSSGGVATLTPAVLPPGVHSLFVSYPGQGVFTPAVSLVVIVNLDPYPTSLVLTDLLNPTVVGTPATFTVQASSLDPNYVPSPIALLEILRGNQQIQLATLTPNQSGFATYTTSSLSVGGHNLVASFTGDSLHAYGRSPYIQHSVISAHATATVLAQVAPNPATPFQQITFTANVSSPSGTPTGTVTFLSGSTTLATVAVDGAGVATTSVNTLGAGTYNITAVYSGSPYYASSTSATVVETVKNTQSIAFPSPQTPVSLGIGPILLSATATSGLPVSFSVLSGPGTINGNLLTLTGLGNVIVAADQAGNANYSSAPQVTRTVVVTGRAVNLTVSATPNPVFLSNSITISAALSATSGIPTGTVTFLDGVTPIHVSTVSASGESFNTTSLTLGNHSITAVYSGDTGFAAATSAATIVVVQDFTLTTQKPNLTIVHEGTATYTLLLGTATGAGLASTVQLSLTGAPDRSVVTFTPAAVPTGSAAVPVTLTIQTPNYPTGPFDARNATSGKLTVAILLIGGLLLPWRRRFATVGLFRKSSNIALVLIALAATTLTGCGSGWRTQHWNMTVTATSGNLSRTVNLTLTSQCRNLNAACPIE